MSKGLVERVARAIEAKAKVTFWYDKNGNVCGWEVCEPKAVARAAVAIVLDEAAKVAELIGGDQDEPVCFEVAAAIRALKGDE